MYGGATWSRGPPRGRPGPRGHVRSGGPSSGSLPPGPIGVWWAIRRPGPAAGGTGGRVWQRRLGWGRLAWSPEKRDSGPDSPDAGASGPGGGAGRRPIGGRDGATASPRACPMDYKSRFSAVSCRGAWRSGEPRGSEDLFWLQAGVARGAKGPFFCGGNAMRRARAVFAQDNPGAVSPQPSPPESPPESPPGGSLRRALAVAFSTLTPYHPLIPQ